MTKDEQIELMRIVKRGFEDNLKRLRSMPHNGERNIAASKVQEAISWLAVDLNHMVE